MKELDWVRRLNYHGNTAGGARNIIPIGHNELIDLAALHTDLNNFGDNSWERPHRVYIERLNKLDKVHLLGRVRIKTLLINGLINRLLITEKVKHEPKISNESINKPIFIIGLPRTGTTILFSLLSLDPLLRSPKGYEVVSPADNPTHSRKTGITSKHRAQCLFDFEMDIHKEVKAMHDHRQELSVECQNIMLNTSTMFHKEIIGDNSNQICYENSKSQYVWHKKVLQILQYKCVKKKWLLKCPSHINSLDKLYSVYPDAQIIHIHRDPTLAIPSCAKLLKYVTESYCEKNEFVTIFENFVSYLEQGLRKTILHSQSLKINGGIIHNVQLSDIESNPVDTIKTIYQNIGLDFTDEKKNNILSYLKENPRKSHGDYAKEPSAASFPNSRLRDQFKFYTDYYHIPME